MARVLIGNFKGPKGDTGATGATGETGAQGPQGKQGNTGATGAAGATGQRGSRWAVGTAITGTSTTAAIFSGTGIADALVNDMYLNTSNGNTYRCTTPGSANAAKWVYAGNIRGAQGAKGDKGDTGATGATGTTGATGPQGKQGNTGPIGQRGSRWTGGTAITGTSTTATVFSGTGITDALVNDVYLNTSTSNVYRCTVGGTASVAKWVFVGCIKGAKGDKGDKGATGETGPKGPQGPRGEQGPSGTNLTVDTALSQTSTNPVQNKVVNAAIVKKADTILYDKMTGALYLKSGSTVLSSAEIKSLPPGLKIVTFANGTDEEIAKMIQAHYDNKINIYDYWAVGDTRTVSLSAMEATGVGESHRAQTVKFVIGDFDHDDLTTPINGHTKAAVTLLQKDCLMDAANASNPVKGSRNSENGYMNSTNTNVGGWKNCARRTWCNNVFFTALPSAWQSMVKTVNKKVSAGNNSSTIETVQDKIFLAAEIEIFGSTTYSFAGEGTQYQYYKNATANRYKMPKWDSSFASHAYWERSPRSRNASFFCSAGISGDAAINYANAANGVAPCLCI